MSELTSLAERARADASPITPAPLEQIERRAHARGRRRKVVAGAVCGAVVVLVLLTGIAVGAGRSQDGTDSRLDVVSPATTPTTAPALPVLPPPATNATTVPTTPLPTTATSVALPPSTTRPPTTVAPTTPPTTAPPTTIAPTTSAPAVTLDCGGISWAQYSDWASYDIKATGVTCADATALVRLHHLAPPQAEGSTYSFQGYRCTEVDAHTELRSTLITCVQGEHIVRWNAT